MKRHYYFFDFARVIAALLVLLVHARVEILTPYSLLPEESQTLLTKIFYAVCSLGTDGVIVFFVISGFLVGGRNLEMLIHGNGSAKEFAINRLCRIYPPLLAALALCCLQKYIAGDVIDYVNLIGNIFCLQGIVATPEMPVLWTIAYEMFFYLFLFSMLLLRSKNAVGWGIVFIGITLIFVFRLQICFWSPLFFGCLLYFIKDKLSSHKSFFSISLVLGFLSSIGEKITCESSAVNFLSDMISHESVIVIESICFATFLSYLAMSEPQHKVSKAMELFGNRYAKFSYSLFLCHYPLLKIAHHFLNKSLPVDLFGVVVMLTICIICIAFSYFFYSLTEKHTNTIINRISIIFNKES